MTIEQIKQLLEGSGADAWELTDTETEGWEFYFIRHKLDQNRVKAVRHTKVCVYRKCDDGASLGSASEELPPTATPEEAEALIRDLLFRATLVKNPVYELNKPSGIPPAAGPKSPSAEVSDIARAFLSAMKSIPETSTEDINSYEIFVNMDKVRFLNSEGIDLTETRPSSMVEVVVNAREGSHEIELYRLYHSGTCDAEALTRDLTETLRYGKDRLLAVPTPPLGKAAVVFPTADAVQIYDNWFVTRMNASMKYRRYSDWEIGQPVAKDVKGDTVTVRAVASLPNSSENRAFDPEGAPVHDLLLIENNVPKNFWGGRQFSQYLGLTDSFLAGNFSVEGGSKMASELRTGQYLEVVEFSDFAVDPLSGDIAGEIRLAYWHDGTKITPVSGGSVSGTMTDFVREMYLSRETRQYDHYLIPAVTRLEGVTIAGIEQ